MELVRLQWLGAAGVPLATSRVACGWTWRELPAHVQLALRESLARVA